jgi:competence protein ComEA
VPRGVIRRPPGGYWRRPEAAKPQPTPEEESDSFLGCAVTVVVILITWVLTGNDAWTTFVVGLVALLVSAVGAAIRQLQREDAAQRRFHQQPTPASSPSASGDAFAEAFSKYLSEDLHRPPRTIDINTASQDELERLPGIGPVTAARIIAARNDHAFRGMQDLQSRKLIGMKALARLTDHGVTAFPTRTTDPRRQTPRGQGGSHGARPRASDDRPSPPDSR